MADHDDYLEFGQVARSQLGEQCQYAARFARGRTGYPPLGEGLRFLNLHTDSYHDILIHRDDVQTFVERFRRHMGEPT